MALTYKGEFTTTLQVTAHSYDVPRLPSTACRPFWHSATWLRWATSARRCWCQPWTWWALSMTYLAWGRAALCSPRSWSGLPTMTAMTEVLQKAKSRWWATSSSGPRSSSRWVTWWSHSVETVERLHSPLIIFYCDCICSHTSPQIESILIVRPRLHPFSKFVPDCIDSHSSSLFVSLLPAMCACLMGPILCYYQALLLFLPSITSTTRKPRKPVLTRMGISRQGTWLTCATVVCLLTCVKKVSLRAVMIQCEGAHTAILFELLRWP